MNTSLSVYYNVYFEVIEFCNSSNISRSKIVRNLLKMALKRINADKIDTILVEYQDSVDEKCEILHFSVDEELCKKLGHFRDRFRISISKVFCAAFLLYWKQLIKEIIEGKEVCFSSYEKIYEKLEYLVPYFKERLGLRVEIIKKE